MSAGGGSFGELGSLLKQAQQMQRDLDKVRAELRERTVQGTAGGGMVQVEVTGDRRVTRIDIAPEVVAEGDKAQIEELVLAALRDGIGKAARLAEETMGKVTGGVNLPGLF
jgi:hypothetical protein